jgi:phospholipid/cholesterol/gamma-HCH transport system substrate-binding protein
VARSRRRDLLLAGAFVVTMVALAVAAVTLVMPGLFGGTYRLKTFFADASGLTPGLEVVQNGYTIGILESVRPVFPGRDPEAGHCPRDDGDPAPPHKPCFRAALRIQGGWPIGEGSRAQLGSSGLLQGKVIKLLAGPGAGRLADGAVVPSVASEPDLGRQLSALTDSIQSIIDETIAPALASLEHQIRTIEGLLGTAGEESENKDRLAGAFENLQRLTGDLERAVDPEQIANILGSVEQLSVNLSRVSAELSERTGAVERAVNQYNALAADIRAVLERTSPPLERSLDDTQYLLQELSAALTPILSNVEEATRNLSALSRDLRDNPAVIIRGRKVKEDTPWFE